MTNKPFCESCDSQGTRHKKDCPTQEKKESGDVLNAILSQIENMSSTVSSLSDAIVKTNERIDTLIPAPKAPINESSPVTKKEPKQDIKWMEQIPPRWMEIKREFFDDDFEMKMEWTAAGDTMMHIFIPDKYARPDAKFRVGGDVSTGFIRKNSSEEDIRSWCEKIKANVKKFNPNLA